MFNPRSFVPSALTFLCAGIAAPAAAQDLCGGIGASGQWIGGSEAASDVSAASGHLEQLALVLGGNQHVALFSLSQPTAVRVEAQGRGSGDPIIDLYDENGILVVSDDDSGGDGASRAEPDLAPGVYCLATSSYDGSPMTATVRVGTLDQDPLTAGVEDIGSPDSGGAGEGSCDTAVDLGTLDGRLMATNSVQEAPYLRFTLDRSMPISILARNEDADPLVILSTADGEYISENDDFDGLNSRLDQAEALDAGDYCIEMQALSDTSLPIELEITEYDPVAALNALYESGDAAPPMDGAYPVSDLGVLSTRLRQDVQVGGSTLWFAVRLEDAGLMLIEAISTDGAGDPIVRLFDDRGREVAFNDDYGDSYDSLVAARVTAGEYMFGVKQVGEGVQGFVRIILERYVPAK